MGGIFQKDRRGAPERLGSDPVVDHLERLAVGVRHGIGEHPEGVVGVGEILGVDVTDGSRAAGFLRVGHGVAVAGVDAHHPKATSSIIITEKPAIVAMVTKSMFWYLL